MSNLIRSEFYKLRKSKYFIVMLPLSILIGLCLIWMWDSDVNHWKSTAPNNINGVYSIVYSFGWNMLTSFIFALLAIGTIVKDFKTSNVINCFCCGYSRRKVILSKLVAFTLFSLFLELIYTMFLVIYASLSYGFWGSLDINYLYLTRIIVIYILCSSSSTSIIAMIAIVSRSNLITIVSPIILMICYSLSTSKFNPFIQKIFSYMPNVAGLLASEPHLPISYAVIGVISSIVTFIITIGSSLLYIKHKDIK